MSDGENLNPEKENSGATPAEETEVQPVEENTEEGETQSGGSTGQNAELGEELEKAKSEMEKLREELKKKDADFKQLGYRYRKIKERAEEMGVDLEEEMGGSGLSREEVEELLQQNTEQITKRFEAKFSELLKGLTSQQKKVSVGGGGQKPPAPKYPIPDAPHVKRLIQSGWKWDSQKGRLISPRGKEYDISDLSDLGQLK